MRTEISQQVRDNRGSMIGVDVQGDIHSGEFYTLQVYALPDVGRTAAWRRFLDANAPPYPYLEPYTLPDRVLFKGRDEQVAKVVQRIGERRLLVLHGPRSVGKTSLLTAGVVPELMERGGLVIQVQDYHQPVGALRQALAGQLADAPDALPDDAALAEVLRASVDVTGGTQVLVLDQFERLFEPTLDTDRRSAFVDDLRRSLEIIAPDYLRVIIAVRDEALGPLGELQDVLPGLLQTSLRLQPLSREQAVDAIEQPLIELDSRVAYADGFVPTHLVPDLDDLSPAYAGHVLPAHLQIVCRQLYTMARERRPAVVDERLYLEDARGADGILAAYLENELDVRFAGQRGLAEGILAKLAAPGAGAWVTPDAFPRGGAARDEFNRILENLLDASLLVRRKVNGQPEYGFSGAVLRDSVRHLAGPAAQKRLQVEDELERIWSAWLVRDDTLATPEQLRYLASGAASLDPEPVKVLLLLRSAVAHGEPPALWLDRLRSNAGRALIGQLETAAEPDIRYRASPTIRAHARRLLGVTTPAEPVNTDHSDFGPVARGAASGADPRSWQTAALSLMALEPYPRAALDRLHAALAAAELPRRQMRRRRVELRAALADADPATPEVTSGLPVLDRFGVWLWRLRRRVFRDRHRIAAFILGSAIMAGLALGFWRALMVLLAPMNPTEKPAIHFAINSWWGALVGAAVALGIALVDPLRLSPAEDTERSAAWQTPVHADRVPALLASALAFLLFGVSHVAVAIFTGSSIPPPTLSIVAGFIAGLGIGAAMYAQPGAGARLGFAGWLWRLAATILAFAAAAWTFSATTERGGTLAIGWSRGTYRRVLSRYLERRYVELSSTEPEWLDLLPMADLILVGIVLVVSITVGLALGRRLLAWWRTVVERGGY